MASADDEIKLCRLIFYGGKRKMGNWNEDLHNPAAR